MSAVPGSSSSEQPQSPPGHPRPQKSSVLNQQTPFWSLSFWFKGLKQLPPGNIQTPQAGCRPAPSSNSPSPLHLTLGVHLPDLKPEHLAGSAHAHCVLVYPRVSLPSCSGTFSTSTVPAAPVPCSSLPGENCSLPDPDNQLRTSPQHMVLPQMHSTKNSSAQPVFLGEGLKEPGNTSCPHPGGGLHGHL